MFDYRRDLETVIYEGHKDAFGVKGRHYNFNKMTIAQLEAEAASICYQVGLTMEAEEKAEKEALASFESRVLECLKLGAGSRHDAIRWVLEAENLDEEYDAGYICYNLGLSYKEADMFKPFVNDYYDQTGS